MLKVKLTITESERRCGYSQEGQEFIEEDLCPQLCHELWNSIVEISDSEQKMQVTRQILEALPEWFGIPESREEYIRDSVDQVFFAALEEDKPIGFLCLKETGKATAELAVMGVLKEYHRKGIGRKLFEKAKAVAKQTGYSFLQVKTVEMGRYEEYDRTNQFYLSLGFKELEVFPTLWDEWNPCQIYVMAI